MAHRPTASASRPDPTAALASPQPARAAPGSITLRFGGAVVGTLVGSTPQGVPLVDYPANPSMAHLSAQTCVPLTAGDHGKGAVLLFDEGDPHKPVIVGLIQAPVAAMQAEAPDAQAMPLAETSVEVDGQALAISAASTLTLRCGDASITLTREGQVIVRGTQVHTRASGLNRIQGASVRIN